MEAIDTENESFEIVALNGPLAGRVVPLEAGRTVVIGRKEPSDVIMPDPTLSGRHARLVAEGGGVRVEDLGSTNGTRVNGHPVRRHRVEGGDTLRLGELRFLVRSTAGEEQDSPPAVVESDLLGARRPEGRAFVPGATIVSPCPDPESDVPNLLFELGRIGASSTLDEAALVRQVLDLVRRFLDSDRVAFQPASENGVGDYVTTTGLGNRIPRIPRSVLAQVREGRTVSMLYGESLENGHATTTIVDQGIETLICAPVSVGPEFLGTLYADRIIRRGPFDRRAPEALSAVADLLGSHLARLRAVQRTIEYERRLQECQSQALSGLVATGVAHDLANHLASLSGYAQVAAEDPKSQPALPEQVLRLSSRAAAAVRTILALGGRMAEPRATFDVRTTVGQAAALLEGRARSAGIRSDVQLDPRCCLVEGSSLEILDALVQLGLNALEASRAGAEVRLSARRENGSIVLAVADTGPGIPPARLQEILERTEDAPGYGLRLVHRIVEAHRGRLALKSLVGEGTTAEITLRSAGPPTAVA